MEKIKIHRERNHSKASERYLDVTFTYDDGTSWEGSIPIEYRRTGTDLSDKSEIDEYLLQAYDCCHSSKNQEWLLEQEEFWKGKSKAEVTKPFFNALVTFEWTCTTCQLPSNPNWARRNQDLKEFGYTIATDTRRFCHKCNQKRTHVLLVPLPRGGLSGYESWSPALRDNIITALRGYDSYEGKKGNKDSLLPDHKFPEIRWDSNTRRDSLENFTDQEIKTEFQLMSNQRNLQKREVCRTCYQTSMRGYPFGIKFYYNGNENWPVNVPKTGKDAENGCVGCGWYDLEAWREALNQTILDFAQHS